ncbi:MAG: hypothetical protein D6741_11315 [Planctomycetota bacterium]|nr:MAG: hypothetical protein D6741_11315 [Planctomycetota bacterium]
MSCKHLKELFELCRRNQLQFSSSELIRIVCPQCGVEETCPSMQDAEYEERHKDDAETPDASDSAADS